MFDETHSKHVKNVLLIAYIDVVMITFLATILFMFAPIVLYNIEKFAQPICLTQSKVDSFMSDLNSFYFREFNVRRRLYYVRAQSSDTSCT